jgi:hypothetical protein
MTDKNDNEENAISKVFTKMSDTINGGERAILDFISVFVPWAVPVIPAYLTYWHTLDQMGFPDWVAKTAAFVVEALGLVSVATAIRFWKNNTLYKADREKAPFWLAVIVYVFYIVIVLTVNVLLEIVTGARSSAVIWAIGLFTLLSFPASVLIAVRAQFREQLEDRREKHSLRNNKNKPSSGLEFVPLNLDVPFGEGREKLRKNCISCGREFVTTYPNKKTCSDACRKRLSRDKSGNVL